MYMGCIVLFIVLVKYKSIESCQMVKKNNNTKDCKKKWERKNTLAKGKKQLNVWNAPSYPTTPLNILLMVVFSQFFIRWWIATNWMQQADNLLFSNNNSKQIHTNPLLTFLKFWLPCAGNSGCHIHVHTVKYAHISHQYATVPLSCQLKEVQFQQEFLLF